MYDYNCNVPKMCFLHNASVSPWHREDMIALLGDIKPHALH